MGRTEENIAIELAELGRLSRVCFLQAPSDQLVATRPIQYSQVSGPAHKYLSFWNGTEQLWYMCANSGIYVRNSGIYVRMLKMVYCAMVGEN